MNATKSELQEAYDVLLPNDLKTALDDITAHMKEVRDGFDSVDVGEWVINHWLASVSFPADAIPTEPSP